MRVLSWNIGANRGIRRDMAERVAAAIARQDPDIVTLQEVRVGIAADRLQDELAEHGLGSFEFSGRLGAKAKPYGNLIATRHEIVRKTKRWPKPVPWPQLLAGATIRVDGHDVEVVRAHIPNGSANGWKKVDTLVGLAKHMDRMGDVPRIVTGDFNEPRRFGPEHRVVSFGEIAGRSRPTLEGKLRRNGVSRPRREWQEAVERVFDREDLWHAHSELRDPRRLFTYETHAQRDARRYFDHIFVSRHFDVERAGFHHSWRRRKLSDHAATWVDLEL